MLANSYLLNAMNRLWTFHSHNVSYRCRQNIVKKLEITPLQCLLGSGSGSCNASLPSAQVSLSHPQGAAIQSGTIRAFGRCAESSSIQPYHWLDGKVCDLWKDYTEFQKMPSLDLSVHGNITSLTFTRGKKYSLVTSECSGNMVILLTFKG